MILVCCKIYSQDWKGNTPLFEACRNGHVHIVDLLIKQYVLYITTSPYLTIIYT